MKIPRIVYAVLLVSVAGLNVCVAGAPKLIIAPITTQLAMTDKWAQWLRSYTGRE